MKDMDRTREQHVDWPLTLAVFGGVVAVAYADSVVVSISLGYLYVLPLSLAGLAIAPMMRRYLSGGKRLRGTLVLLPSLATARADIEAPTVSL